MMSDGTTTVSVSLIGNLDPQDTSSTQIVVSGSRTFTPIMTGFLQSFWDIDPFQLDAVATAEVFK
jgi:hypothetical protein